MPAAGPRASRPTWTRRTALGQCTAARRLAPITSASAPLFASVIYAGSFEFLLVGLVTAVVPLAAVALTAFLVNVRHVFYSVSFPLHRVHDRGAKTYSRFALTDEAYALSTSAQARSWPTRRILWLQGFLHLYWVTGATAGALLGALARTG